MSDNILGEFLSKLGYSKFALDSEIVTEDMLDEMYLQTNYCSTTQLFDDKNGNEPCKMIQADGNTSFDTTPTLVKTCH